MNNKITKAHFKKCAISDRKIFNKSTCIMPISVGFGLTVHEDTKFLATIKLISAHFKKCTILIDDTIQRYTKQISNQHLDLDELKNVMIREGDSWLERNKHIYEQLAIPYDILRWDDWHKHPEYHSSCKKVEDLYQNDESYYQIVNDNIKQFLERHTAYMNIKEYDYKTAFDNCVLYLKEECSVMCLWAADGYDFEVYPSGRNCSMQATYERLVEPVYPNLLKSVSIGFKKY